MRARRSMHGALAGLGGLFGALSLAPPAAAHHPGLSGAAALASPAEVAQGCPGRGIDPDRVITGSFGVSEEKTYVMVPFRVPKGTTAVRVKYCYDGPDIPVSTPAFSLNNTLDLGLYESRRTGRKLWGAREFRGWGGSSHPDVTVSAQGFSSRAQYEAEPRVEPPGKTTRAFLPGPIRPGRWAVELGVAKVLTPAEGNLDGRVDWRVEVELADNPRFTRTPYRAKPYDRTPANRKPGWYAGDMHVHAEHSAYGDATMRETFDFAFTPRPQGGAGLDFVTLSDYVSGSAWGEIGRHQPRYRGKLIIPSAEVITYRGHLNNHASGRILDYRTDPVLVHDAEDDSVERARAPRDPRQLFRQIRRARGFTQINHPTIFPSAVPAFAAFCRGCPWDFSPRRTGYGRVDGIEVATGPAGLRSPVPGLPLQQGPNPFTATAIDFYERALAAGHRIAAIGVSDSHNAGRTPNPVTQSPIGEATTVVRARRLGVNAIRCAVRAGHTYVKVTGSHGPDLRMRARPPGPFRGAPAIFGDTVRAPRAEFVARVLGGAGSQLTVYRDNAPLHSVPVTGATFTHRFVAEQPGRYRLQLMRDSTIEAVSTPIWLEPGNGRVIGRHSCEHLVRRGGAGAAG